ncbi:MAG TPA: helix-turn-helix domain-containing protein, partial [Kofleriaceae bacterium]|nr:helix-turn-helix domain-containing protein [Kofleriaceae bacterium]
GVTGAAAHGVAGAAATAGLTSGAIADAAVEADAEPLSAPDGGPSLREQVEAFERNVIARTLAAVGGNQSEAARRLGTSRVTLLDKVKKYGLGPRRD